MKNIQLRNLFLIIIGIVFVLILFYNIYQDKISNNYQYLSENFIIKYKKIEVLSYDLPQRLPLSDYYFDRYSNYNSSNSTIFKNGLTYSEDIFRLSSSPPILWLDSHGDIRWNKAAEREIYFYLLNKQTINSNMTENETIDECLRRQLFIVHQDDWGFFSRYHCFIEQFGQTLYTPWMSIITYRRFRHWLATLEDFLDEGILRYVEPICTCAKYLQHPRMKSIEQLLKYNSTNNLQKITNIHQLLYKNQLKTNRKYFIIDKSKVWSFGYDHIPLRRWMFSYQRFSPTYNLSIQFLINHKNEHIYKSPLLTKDFIKNWTPKNRPIVQATEHLPGSKYNLTWEDHLFTGFIRYMLILYFHQFVPRIHHMTHLLAQYWSSYLMDKYQQSLDNMAAIQIRRTDKKIEDSFWRKYKRWRNISMYIKGLVDQEIYRNKTFSSIFIMSDDYLVIKSIQDYSNIKSNGTDEIYARKYLQKRNILYNIFAPQYCIDPFSRIDFDQFLVSIQFIIKYAQFIVSHTDSNIGRYLQEIIYSRQQLNSFVHTNSFVKNAPDSL